MSDGNQATCLLHGLKPTNQVQTYLVDVFFRWRFMSDYDNAARRRSFLFSAASVSQPARSTRHKQLAGERIKT